MATVKRLGPAVTVCLGAWMMVGCVSLKAPERIEVGSRNAPPKVDSSKVPPTSNHAEARQRLAEAYQRNAYLERRVADLEAKCDRYEEKYDEERDRRKACEDRLEDYED